MGKNQQLHLVIETETFNRLSEEANREDITLSELCRRKLANPPTEEEVILFRKLKDLLLTKSRGGGK